MSASAAVASESQLGSLSGNLARVDRTSLFFQLTQMLECARGAQLNVVAVCSGNRGPAALEASMRSPLCADVASPPPLAPLQPPEGHVQPEPPIQPEPPLPLPPPPLLPPLPMPQPPQPPQSPGSNGTCTSTFVLSFDPSQDFTAWPGSPPTCELHRCRTAWRLWDGGESCKAVPLQDMQCDGGEICGGCQREEPGRVHKDEAACVRMRRCA
eukprot:363411-Chlamydomonas_euryale.AAC.3